MSSYDKVVKAATKPKPTAPKQKYIDPIIAATFSSDGSLQDICRSLSGRVIERDGLVVFKALIILHTMMRNGNVDNVLGHLASEGTEVRIRNVSRATHLPGSMSSYAQYLEDRVRAYRELKHDIIRSTPTSSKGSNGATEQSNRLRKLSVAKGLLREIGITQKVGNAALNCSFFHDDLQDELTLMAFRMTLKDLLALYTGVNEGIINMLEHYFEMSKPDAERALELYKRFCRQTEKVVAYLSAARRAAGTLNINIPNLKHAPISLAGALEEYLADYDASQSGTQGGAEASKTNGKAAEGTASKAKDAPAASASASTSASTSTAQPAAQSQALQDFFASIEGEQQSMFNPSPHPPTVPGFNNGAPVNGGLFGAVGPQPTGMGVPGAMAPQMTGFNPFLQQQQMGFPQQQQMPFAQPQQTGFPMQPQMTGFVQPQMTGYNPFRQTIIGMPTGMAGGGINEWGMQNGQQLQQQPQQQQPPQQAPPNNSPFGSAFPSANNTNSLPTSSSAPSLTSPPAPAPSSSVKFAPSTLGSISESSAVSTSAPKKIAPQKTGSRNPFAPPPGSTPPPSPPPAGPKGPTLNDLANSAFGSGAYSLGAGQWNGQPAASAQGGAQQQQQAATPAQPAQPSGIIPQATGMGSIASEFAFGRTGLSSPATASQQSPTPTGATSTPGTTATGSNGFASAFSGMSLGGTATAPISVASGPASPLQPQATGFGGSSIRPFQPSSAFGASLAAGRTPGSPSAAGSALAPQMTGNPFALAGQPTGVSAGTSLFGGSTGTNGTQPASGLSAQPTGFGASLFAGSTAGAGAMPPAVAPQPTGFAGSTVRPFQPSSAFGSAAFGALGQGQSQGQQQGQTQGQGQQGTGTAVGSLF